MYSVAVRRAAGILYCLPATSVPSQQRKFEIGQTRVALERRPPIARPNSQAGALSSRSMGTQGRERLHTAHRGVLQGGTPGRGRAGAPPPARKRERSERHTRDSDFYSAVDSTVMRSRHSLDTSPGAGRVSIAHIAGPNGKQTSRKTESRKPRYVCGRKMHPHQPKEKIGTVRYMY